MKIVNKIISSCVFLCAAQNSLAAQIQKIAPDFSVINLEKHEKVPPHFIDNTLNCKQNIQDVMCFVDPVQGDPEQNPFARSCLPDSRKEKFVTFFQELHDQYPAELQKMFCSVKRIFVEKQDFGGTAYAGVAVDQQGQKHAIMGIRASVVEMGDPRLDFWVSWKEQLSFGGILEKYVLTPGLPFIGSAPIGYNNDFIYYVIAHEFGHIFDFANQLNNFEETKNGWEAKPGSWSALSWKTFETPKDQFNFQDRDKLCFYWCEGKTIARENINQMYADLSKTNFMSFYASTNPYDDFAETMAFTYLRKGLHSTYILNTGAGESYDMMRKLRSPLLKSKMNYIHKLMTSPDLRYP